MDKKEPNILQKATILFGAFGEAALVNLLGIILVIMLYLFYWTFPQAKDLLLIINQGGDEWVVLFFTSLSVLAIVSWYLPRYCYSENLKKDLGFWAFVKTSVEGHYYPTHEKDGFSRKKAVAIFKEMMPRTIGTLVFLIPTIGVVNVANEMGDKILLGLPANLVLLISIAILLVIQWNTRKIQNQVSNIGNILMFVLSVIIMIASIGMLITLRNNNNLDTQSLRLIFYTGIYLAGTFLYITIIRKNFYKKMVKIIGSITEKIAESQATEKEKKQIKDIIYSVLNFILPALNKQAKTILALIPLLTIALCLGFILINIFPHLSQFLNPLVCANLAFIFYLTALYTLQIFGNQKSMNLVLFVFIGVVLLAMVRNSNEHHKISLAEKVIDSDKRMDLDEYLEEWVLQRSDTIQAWLNRTNNDTYPIFIVSAEGGGSRAAYWTSITHAYLQDTIPGYYDNHLFALTGASGGTTGNSTFFALKDGGVEDDSLHSASNKMFGKNFLSSSFTMLLGLDLWNDIFGSSFWDDRAKRLEEEWASQIVEATGKKNIDLSRSFLSFWYRQNAEKPTFDKPLLFINSTQVQKGGHAVMAPVKLNPDTYVGMDLLDKIQETHPDKSIPLRTGMLLNASFPYINPAGNIENVGSFVDAGYYDNFGARTAKSIIQELKNFQNQPDSTRSPLIEKIKFVSILIRNGTADPKVEPGTTTSQLSAPLSTIGNIRSAVNVHNRMELKEVADSFYEVNLERPKFSPSAGAPEIEPIIPLARFLSPLALRAMDEAQRQDEEQLSAILSEVTAVVTVASD